MSVVLLLQGTRKTFTWFVLFHWKFVATSRHIVLQSSALFSSLIHSRFFLHHLHVFLRLILQIKQAFWNSFTFWLPTTSWCLLQSTTSPILSPACVTGSSLWELTSLSLWETTIKSPKVTLWFYCVNEFFYLCSPFHGRTLTHWWRSAGDIARLPPLWPGVDFGPMPWIELVVGSRHTPRVFLRRTRRVLQFSSCHKNNHAKFQFDQNRGPAWTLAKGDVAFSLTIILHLFYIFNIIFMVSCFRYSRYRRRDNRGSWWKCVRTGRRVKLFQTPGSGSRESLGHICTEQKRGEL